MTRDIAVRRVLAALVLTASLAGPLAARAASGSESDPPEPTHAVVPLYFDSLRVSSDFRRASAPAHSRQSGFRERNLALLRYDTPLRIGESDVLFKLRAPGSKRSIVTFEFRF